MFGDGQREDVDMHACVIVLLCECRFVFGVDGWRMFEMHACIIDVL